MLRVPVVQVIAEYKNAYLASTRMKQQVVLLLTMAAAEMEDQRGGPNEGPFRDCELRMPRDGGQGSNLE